ncbi:MAG: hypothetical protein ACRDTE_00840 [Pseudonocardiaceae bacterium]
MTIGVGIHWKYRVVSDVDLFAHAERLTEALLELETATPGLQDSAVSADRGQGVIEVEVSAVGQSEDEAIVIGQAAVDAAISAAGGELRSLLPTSLETSRMAVA